jgi:hypothetical protein
MRDTRYWRRMMENDGSLPEVETGETATKTEIDETQIIEEVVYPFRLTEGMLQQYQDPAFNRSNLGDAYVEVLVKLLRSAKFWRISIPRWLLDRLNTFGVL